MRGEEQVEWETQITPQGRVLCLRRLLRKYGRTPFTLVRLAVELRYFEAYGAARNLLFEVKLNNSRKLTLRFVDLAIPGEGCSAGAGR